MGRYLAIAKRARARLLEAEILEAGRRAGWPWVRVGPCRAIPSGEDGWRIEVYPNQVSYTILQTRNNGQGVEKSDKLRPILLYP